MSTAEPTQVSQSSSNKDTSATEQDLPTEDYFSREVCLDHLGDTPLVIHQQSLGDVGGVVWDGALVLAHFLARFRADFLRDATVVELGAGTGVVGLTLATLPGTKRVILTDLPALAKLAQFNIDANKQLLRAQCEFQALDWNSPQNLRLAAHLSGDYTQGGATHNKPKLLVASECVYYEDAVTPLVDTMDFLSDEQTRTFVSFEFRTFEKNVRALKEFLRLAKKRFDVKEVPTVEQHEDYRSEDIKILLLTKKKRR